MKQTIEIEVPEGKRAVWKDNKVVFENIMPKTWEEFCDLCNIKPTKEYYIEADSSIRAYDPGCNPDLSAERVCDMDCNLLPSKEAAEAHLALMQLHQLRDYYRQGWKPGNRIGEFVHNIIRNEDGSLSIESKLAGARFLSFQEESIAEEFRMNFYDLITKAGDLI